MRNWKTKKGEYHITIKHMGLDKDDVKWVGIADAGAGPAALFLIVFKFVCQVTEAALLQ